MNTRKTPLLAGLLGNALEWYDFILYANFATIIARLFFPNENPTVALLLTFGVFASSFLVRPLGAVLFGYIGDHLGRRIALITSISLMSVPTLLIGFLPTYASTGIAAPIFLLILRLLQGIAISGELNSAATFLVEHAKKNRRGLAGSLVMGTVFFGALIGAALSTLLTVILTPEALASWGWRLLFVLGGLAGITGLIVRLRMQESARFLSQKETAKRLPLSYVFLNYPKQMCIAIALTSIMAVGNHTIFAYVMTFLVKFTHLTTEQANIINLLGFVVIVLLFPVMGLLSDKYGRKPIFKCGLLSMIFCAFPIFWLLSQSNFYYALAGEILLCVALVPIAALIPTMLAELFPTYIRNSGSAISYNICLAIFGGTAPLVSLALRQEIGNLAPAAYLIVCALIAFFALRFIRESYHRPLI